MGERHAPCGTPDRSGKAGPMWSAMRMEAVRSVRKLHIMRTRGLGGELQQFHLEAVSPDLIKGFGDVSQCHCEHFLWPNGVVRDGFMEGC